MPGSRFSLLCVLTALSTTSGFELAGPVFVHPAGASASTERAAHSVIPDAVARPLPFYYDLYTFRGERGRTEIVTAFAVEAGRLETESGDDRVRYRFSVTLVLADPALSSVTSTHDTVYVDVARSLPDDHLLYTHVEVLAPPSHTTAQRVIMIDATTPGIGQLYSADFPIPDYSGSELMLSDIALGQPDAKDGWKRGPVTLALLPTSQFPSSAFDVYYEIYNLPAGHRYTTEIAVASADGDPSERADEDPVGLHFSGESSAGPDDVLAELRRVQTSLPRGKYRIIVTIRDLETGATATRSRAFEVRRHEAGATMVAALPQRTERPR